MYSERELNRLADLKTRLRRDIALRRNQCAGAAARIVRPLAWLDRVLVVWKQLPLVTQLAVVPLGYFVTRSALSRRGMLGALVRWGPIAFAFARSIGYPAKRRSVRGRHGKVRSLSPICRDKHHGRGSDPGF